MNGIWEFLLSLVNLQQIVVLTSLLVANMLTGALAGAVTGTFDWGKLKDIWKRAGVVFGAYLVIATLAQFLLNLGAGDGWDAIRTAITVYLSAYLVQKILDSLREMGIPVPDINKLWGLRKLSCNLK
jgi:phage-related holin